MEEILKVVHEARNELTPYLLRLNFEKLARYNHGYIKYASNPVEYFIDQELNRYIKTMSFLSRKIVRGARIVDIGLFIPLIPIALTKLGYRITTIENLSFYDGSLDEIVDLVTKKYNIELINADIMSETLLEFHNQFDAVLLLAILEHLNGTPRFVLGKAKALLQENGYLVIDVPNVSSLGKRLAYLIKGYPPFPSFTDYYLSDYPFLGHNREYTSGDLEYLLGEMGLVIEEIDAFHNGEIQFLPRRARLIRWIEKIGPFDWKPTIWVASKMVLDKEETVG